jgi:endonuclease-3
MARQPLSVAVEKRPFDLRVAIPRLRKAVAPLPKAAMFQLAEEGYRSVFEQLVACVISVRTLDESMLTAARRLFAAAPTPAAMARLSVAAIDALIRESTFHETKARDIREISRRTADEFGGELPADFAVLTSFHGVGPKCANLTLGIAAGQAAIGVDIHVHRVTNRWGYVRAATPEKTMGALQTALPKRLWVEINALLVPFGKHICTGFVPKCSTCPLLEMCEQVGVTSHR